MKWLLAVALRLVPASAAAQELVSAPGTGAQLMWIAIPSIRVNAEIVCRWAWKKTAPP